MGREKGVNTGEKERWPWVRVAGAPGPACACGCGAVCGGAGGLPGGERDSETFERRQTLPLSTLTPTISQKKAVNPLLPGQARGKVSANSQLPNLPRLMPFGQVNNFIATGPLLRAPAFAGSFPKAPRGVLLSPPLSPPRRAAKSLRGFAQVWVCLRGQGGGEKRGGTRRQ